jgi:RimJ/RimL family protein N-acetyltransferase
MPIVTKRLVLKPLTPELIALQLGHNPSFFKGIGASPRGDWPPPLYDDDALKWTLGRLTNGEDARWHMRAVRTRRPLFGSARALGVAGFKGPPDANGEVEIGYSIVASEQRRGFGAEAVAALLEFAFADSRVNFVSAHTLDSDVTIASRRVLEGAGFAGPISTEEIGVVRYELPRESLSGPRITSLANHFGVSADGSRT